MPAILYIFNYDIWNITIKSSSSNELLLLRETFVLLFVQLWLIGNRLSNSVSNHTCEQIGLPLRGHLILLIAHMITEQIGLHSVL